MRSMFYCPKSVSLRPAHLPGDIGQSYQTVKVVESMHSIDFKSEAVFHADRGHYQTMPVVLTPPYTARFQDRDTDSLPSPALLLMSGICPPLDHIIR